MKSFDEEAAAQGKPLVEPHKKTTKVNLFMILAVVAFLAAGIALLFARADPEAERAANRTVELAG